LWSEFWSKYSDSGYRSVVTHATIAELAKGLRRLGVGPGDRVALLAATRPEWTVCELAVAGTGAVCVPIYPTSSGAAGRAGIRW
jgi:long-chain acyl-CoA synthetase